MQEKRLDSGVAKPDAKRQRMLDDISLTQSMNFGSMDEGKYGYDGDNEQISYEELLDVDHADCFACKYMNVESIVGNEKYLYMMKLYTQNASTICRPAIFKKIKDYFDKYIKPDLLMKEKLKYEMNGETVPNDEDIKVENWSEECIRAHFDSHTNFPSDEINIQLKIKRALRRKLSDHLLERTPEMKTEFKNNNIKTLIMLDKEIQALLKLKKDISTMLGYNATLDF